MPFQIAAPEPSLADSLIHIGTDASKSGQNCLSCEELCNDVCKQFPLRKVLEFLKYHLVIVLKRILVGGHDVKK